MNISYVGEGKVVLVAGGSKVYADLAARFTRSEKGLVELLESDYNGELVRKVVDANHLHCLNFDYFIFGVEGYSRVCETQLVRKKHLDPMVKSGRTNKDGKRSFDVVVPRYICKAMQSVKINPDFLRFDGLKLRDCLSGEMYEKLKYSSCKLEIVGSDLLYFTEQWYNQSVEQGYAEEDLRYWKPQATEFKALIGMNAHALRDFFNVRCCMNAQAEIRDMAYKMLAICKDVAPDLFEDAGPHCAKWGCCPENEMQNEVCKGKVLPLLDAKSLMNSYNDFANGGFRCCQESDIDNET